MPISQQIAQMVDILPDADQALAYELVKKLVLAWDPDYTRATAAEDAAMSAALEELSTKNKNQKTYLRFKRSNPLPVPKYGVPVRVLRILHCVGFNSCHTHR